jgi:hypothetical protein
MPNGNYITLIEATEITGYNTGHLRQLLRMGKLEGRKFGRDWFTTIEALEKYKATNPRPGPKPKSKRTHS